MTLRMIHLGFLFAVVLLTVCLYCPVIHYPFLSWDDQGHLTENRNVKSLSSSNVHSIFTSEVNQTYIPLTVLSYAIEYHFFGLNPEVYHCVNILLHLMVVVLLYVFVRGLGCVPLVAGIAALIFAVHPMHVEPVVWITQRKDVLYSLFYLTGLIAYIHYLKEKQWSWFVMVIVCGLLSILAKPMALSYPLILLLIDRWFDRRLSRRMIIEKLPIFLIMILIGWMTYAMNMRLINLNFPQSLLTWLWCFWFYIGKFSDPQNLLILYQLPKPVTLFNPEYYLSLAGIFLLAVLVYRLRSYKWIWFAVFYYGCSIFFLLRFDELKDLTFVADRFMYLPSVGFCIGIGSAIHALLERCSRKQVLRWIMIVGLIIIVGFLYKTTKDRIAVWKNEEKLWQQVIDAYPSAVALTQLGNFYLHRNQLEPAIQYYQKAIAVNAKYSKPYSNYAMVLIKEQKFAQALDLLSAAVKMEDHPSAVLLTNRGYTYMHLGRNDEALMDFTEALAADPYYAPAYLNRATVFKNLQMYEASLKDLLSVLAFDEDNAAAKNNVEILRELTNKK